MPYSKALLKATKKYKKENYKLYQFNVSRKYDNDLIEFLDSQENKSGYIRETLKNSMQIEKYKDKK